MKLTTQIGILFFSFWIIAILFSLFYFQISTTETTTINGTSKMNDKECSCKNGGKRKINSEGKCFCKCKNYWKGKLCDGLFE